MNMALEDLQSTLATDGYALEVVRATDSAIVTVRAGEGVCDDCLVPKSIMTAMLAPALGLQESDIVLRYPEDLEAESR